MTKKELRQEIKRKNLALSTEERYQLSYKIFRTIERSAAFDAARCVALYCALDDEPQTTEALARWSLSRNLVIPRVEGSTMRFYHYNAATLCRGSFGIPEPGPAARSCNPELIDLIIVPGCAFTREGSRLGRGKGYYDRYLALPDLRAKKIGVCYPHQIVDSLDQQPHDVEMDWVVEVE